jgi:hypothetical protein
MQITNKAAIEALKTLHDYYAQPARLVPNSMHKLLDKSFAAVVFVDPYKE